MGRLRYIEPKLGVIHEFVGKETASSQGRVFFAIPHSMDLVASVYRQEWKLLDVEVDERVHV